MKFPNLFRLMFLAGIVVAGISLFFDWYLFQAIDQNGITVVYWGYNPIFNWYSIFEEGSIFNEFYTPTAELIPFTIIIVFLISLSISMIGVIYRTPQRFFSYLIVFSIVLMGFFILMYPIMYLLPNGYYIPWISFYDPYLDLTFTYSMQFGYLMQGLSFILVFPYSIFYYKVANTLEQSSLSPEEILANYVQKIQEPIDLDKFIREEELELAHHQNYSTPKVITPKNHLSKNKRV